MRLAGVSSLETYLCFLLAYLLSVTGDETPPLAYDEFRSRKFQIRAGRTFLNTSLSPCYSDKFHVRPLRWNAQELDSGFHLLDELTAQSALKYEHRANQGCMCFQADASHADLALKLQEPVYITQRRNLRKLLEASNKRWPLMSDSIRVFGMQNRQPLGSFMARFVSDRVWQFCYGSLLEIRNGVPRSFVSQLSVQQVKRELSERLPRDAAINYARISDVLNSAVQHRHGAATIITAEANAERERLVSTATLIRPTVFRSELASRVSTIDGALLIDLNGVCYAMGLIVDGDAGAIAGDPSRGARYNSLLRYVGARRDCGQMCVAVVISEDGDVSWIPLGDDRRRHWWEREPADG